MILITGAAGFIGSVMIWKLNAGGVDAIVGVDELGTGDKWKNLRKLRFHDWVDQDELFEWLPANAGAVDAVVHLGACTDTTERDVDHFIRVNFEFSKGLWRFCAERGKPYLYASSAATYGAGELGYRDDESIVPALRPLNPYGWSKQIFDRWALRQERLPPVWYGFKFFNVYGPNEYHKGRMVSVVHQAFRQAKQSGSIRLFKSHRDGFEDGEQKRDFVYVKDVVDVLDFFLGSRPASGIYNVGSGRARSFNDLALSVFRALGMKPSIEYIDMPEDLRAQYQYFTEAPVGKLKAAGYAGEIKDLESGVEDYVRRYLDTEDPYLG